MNADQLERQIKRQPAERAVKVQDAIDTVLASQASREQALDQAHLIFCTRGALWPVVWAIRVQLDKAARP